MAHHKHNDALSELKVAPRESDSGDMSKRKSPGSSSDDCCQASSLLVPSGSETNLRGAAFQKRRRSFCDSDLLRDGSIADSNFRLRRHSFTVQISDPCRQKSHNLGCHGEASSCEKLFQKPAFKEIRISCPMGDMYSPVYFEHSQRRKLDINKSDKLNEVIDGLEFRGYTATKLLHKGRFSHVLLAYRNHKHHSKHIAIKILDEATSSLEGSHSSQNSEGDLCTWLNPNLPHEVMMLQNLRHVNIVRMLEHVTMQKRTMLFLDFCAAGNLENLVRGHRNKGFLVERVARKYFYQVLAGLSFLHNRSVVHRDLRPANILVDSNDQLKICDLRTARKVQLGQLMKSDDVKLSPYHAPEVFRGSHNPLTADVWALGAILFVMLTGRPPYGDDMQVVEDCAISIKYMDYLDRQITVMSMDAFEILKSLLKFWPHFRFSLTRISNLSWVPVLEDPERSPNLPRPSPPQVFMGNFHLSGGPQKLSTSPWEIKMKEDLGI